MSMKKMLLMIGAVVFFASTALAQPIDFSFVALKGSWSWAGGASPLTMSFDETDIIYNGTEYEVSGSELVNISTLTYVSGAGTLASPFDFAMGGTVTVTGCFGSGCTDVTLFTGTFTADVTAYNAVGKTLHVDASSITGTVDPSVYVELGIPAGTPLTAVGSLNANLAEKAKATVAGGGSGKGGSGNMIVSPTPEAGTISLLLIALVGTVGPTLLRNRKSEKLS